MSRKKISFFTVIWFIGLAYFKHTETSESFDIYRII